MDAAKIEKLEDILTEKQLDQVLRKTSNSGSKIVDAELKPASENMIGFIGEHYKAVLFVEKGEVTKKVHLFVKMKPLMNASKVELMNMFRFYSREASVFKFFDELKDDEFLGSRPWGVKAYVHNENLLVLPDLSVEGYKMAPVEQYFDTNHVLVALTTLAHFHATIANHLTEKIKGDENYDLTKEYPDFSSKDQFSDGLWLRTAATLTANFINEFSHKLHLKNLEELIYKLYKEGCSRLKVCKDSLNVLIHKDLWANNILFQYNGDVPSNAILVDYQATSLGPPAFDTMVLLYLTTSRSFRQRHENKVLSHYYSLFSQCLDEATKERLNRIGYTRNNFLEWCEKGRLFGMMVGLTISPFILLDATETQRMYDDPDTFYKHVMEDRSEPTLAYARENPLFRDRLLDISEEFVERYISCKE